MLAQANESSSSTTGNAAVGRQLQSLVALCVRIQLSNLPVKSLALAMLCIHAAPVTTSHAKEDRKALAVSLVDKVVDGRPWNVHVVERGEKLEMALFPDGSGVADSVIAPTPKWRPTANGLCLKPSALIRERCVTFVVRPNGYDAIENGEVYLELRR
jgi:hypothetical protein